MKHTSFITTLCLCIFCFIQMKAQVFNAGVGGNSSKDLIRRLDSAVLKQHSDLVIIMVGTNDLLNSNKMVSYNSYETNLNSLVTKITATGSGVIMMSSPPADSAYLFLRHDRKLFAEMPNVKMDSARQIVKRVARLLHVKYLDLFQLFVDMNLPKHNEDLYFRNEKNSGKKDGVHPTDLGYTFIAQTVFEFLEKNNLLKKGQKIICFGDSITFGAGATKESSYPSKLSELIDQYFLNKN